MIDHLFAICIHAYYVGELEVGRRACERLLALPDLSPEIELMVRENRTWYAPTLDELAAATFRRLDVDPAHDGWSLFNPTILYRPSQDDFLAIVRSSNYRIVGGKYEIQPSDNGTIRTKNILVQLNRSLAVQSATVIVDPDYPKTEYPVDGLEDCRLRIDSAGRIGVSAVVRNASPWVDGLCRQATATLNVEAAAFADLAILDGLRVQDHEKNWMPIVGRQGWIHSCRFGGHTVTVDEWECGQFEIMQRSPAPPIAASWRGGGQAVPFRDGYLAVVHEVAPCSGHRAYEHRFVWFDNDLRLRLASTPFAFRETKAIEFAAGLAVHDERVIVTFGVRDAEAWLVAVPEDQVWQLLNPLSLPPTSV